MTLDDEFLVKLDREDQPPFRHVLSIEEIRAINAALATGRPLLVRGEPGTGKTQLARAAAVVLGRSFIHQSVDGRTETRDLLWTLDAIQRLATAQLLGAAGDAKLEHLKTVLAPSAFIQPGALWWALDPLDADRRRNAHALSCCVVERHEDDADFKAGTVVLIDEIDKADPSVPNALLDALGQGGFDVPGVGRVNASPQRPTPLVVITTNNERALPSAFLRRCLVLQLSLPPKPDDLIKRLVARGRVHVSDTSEDVLKEAARMLLKDRSAAEERHLSLPGLAEYLDLVRAVATLFPGDHGAQEKHLHRVRDFALRKHPPEVRRHPLEVRQDPPEESA
ncbi:MAG: MoxR family ATPase [Alphaproteobacteria bacterium]|nr:MoxR family ATPase [Alphaproteobacteria bacterium]